MFTIWDSPFNAFRYTIIHEADEMIRPDWMDEMRKVLSEGDMYTIYHCHHRR